MAVAEIEYDWSAVTEEFPLVLVVMELYWLLIFLREGSLFEYEGSIPLGDKTNNLHVGTPKEMGTYIIKQMKF